MPFGVNLLRSQVLYWAAQGFSDVPEYENPFLAVCMCVSAFACVCACMFVPVSLCMCPVCVPVLC